MMIRHKVIDYKTWKKFYDEHLPARKKATLKEEYLFRNTEELNEVIILFQVKDLKKAKAFAESDDLHETMQKAGVMDLPDVYFLK